MSLFGKCPNCGSLQWRAIERDEAGINKVVKCLDCGVARIRRYTPLESMPLNTKDQKCH